MSMRSGSLALLSAGLLALPLQAQLSPKWQTNNSGDFLDLYQQSNSKSVKPEVVTVFDFSTSMNCIVYHRNYPAPASDDYGNDDAIDFALLTTSISGTTYYYPRAMLRIPDSGGTIAERTSYTFVRPDGTVLIGNPTTPATAPNTAAALSAAQTLIRTTNNTISTPWGATTLISTTNATGFHERDVRNWVRAASHVRFQVNGKNIDVPLNWTILDATSTGYPLSPAYGRDTSTTPATDYPLDTIYTFGYGAFSANSATATSIPLDAGTNGRGSMRYRYAYMRWVFTGTNIPAAETSPGLRNGLPNMNRVQSVKLGAIRAWLANQTKLLFAYRFLSNDDTYGESNRYVINSNSRYNPWNSYNAYHCAVPWDTSCGSSTMGGKDRTWTVMNQNSSGGIRRLAATCSANSTPLTLALANTYAQMNDTNHIFSDVAVDYNTVPETDPSWDPEKDFRPRECMRRFVILFTDGNPNSEPATTDSSPYETAGVGSALTGNAYMVSNPTKANPGQSYWGLPTLAAIAAHLNDETLASYKAPPASYPANTDTSKTVSDFTPFAVKNRGSVTFSGEFAAIQTMTFGVSLGGTYNSGSKGRLFRAAAMGDPRVKTWNISTMIPFELENPADPNSAKKSNSIYFFDANDSASMELYLRKAFEEIAGLSNVNSTSAPVLPTMGTGLGRAVYLAKFQPPKDGGPVWPGDLLMYPIREDSTGLSRLLDSAGNYISGSDLANKALAQWAASDAIVARQWHGRRIYTRQPASSSTAQPPMLRVTVSSGDTAAGISDSGYLAIKPLLPGSTDAIKFDNWRYFIGADVASTSTPKPTRSDAMGDVINSTPAVMEFSTVPASVLSASSTLNTAWTAHSGHNGSFRLIFVGTNQGFLHAFGEVSWEETVAGYIIQKGAVDELWAFAPTDFLPYIDHYRSSSNTHRFGVDGSPTPYLLDLPPVGGVRGNGKFDVGSTSERAIVVFGLGKGGRSYYAIDVRDPMAPGFQENPGDTYGQRMGWSLCPDEPFNYPNSRFVAPASSASSSAITNMGLSTTTPTLGRVVATPTKLVKDLVFLGGGYSVPEIESKLPATPAAPPNANQRLGRSVIALDAKGGNILQVWDLTASSSVGPVSAGVAPHIFFRGSGLHQRAYFADLWGGVWALGYGTLNGSNIRMDSSYLDDWSTSPRPVYKQAPTDGLISSMPVTFAVPGMPTRTSAPLISPAAVGIAFVTGDRNNPLDLYYAAPWNKPDQHRLNVLFDRQDSYLEGLDTNGISNAQMASAGPSPDFPNLSDDERTPSHSSYYLKSKYGYYIRFPHRTTTPGGQFVPKGMFSPLALNGRIFYSYFNPTEANPCTGGTGVTETFRVKNVMLPDASTSDIPIDPVTGKPVDDRSGKILRWTGVSSPFAIRSVTTGMQAGMSGGSWTNTNPNAPQNMQMQSLDIGSSDIYAKPRVWRTVH